MTPGIEITSQMKQLMHIPSTTFPSLQALPHTAIQRLSSRVLETFTARDDLLLQDVDTFLIWHRAERSELIALFELFSQIPTKGELVTSLWILNGEPWTVRIPTLMQTFDENQDARLSTNELALAIDSVLHTGVKLSPHESLVLVSPTYQGTIRIVAAQIMEEILASPAVDQDQLLDVASFSNWFASEASEPSNTLKMVCDCLHVPRTTI